LLIINGSIVLFTLNQDSLVSVIPLLVGCIVLATLFIAVAGMGAVLLISMCAALFLCSRVEEQYVIVPAFWDLRAAVIVGKFTIPKV